MINFDLLNSRASMWNRNPVKPIYKEGKLLDEQGNPYSEIRATPMLPNKYTELDDNALNSLVDFYTIGTAGTPPKYHMDPMTGRNRYDQRFAKHPTSLLSEALADKYKLSPAEQTRLGKRIQQNYWSQYLSKLADKAHIRNTYKIVPQGTID